MPGPGPPQMYPQRRGGRRWRRATGLRGPAHPAKGQPPAPAPKPRRPRHRPPPQPGQTLRVHRPAPHQGPATPLPGGPAARCRPRPRRPARAVPGGLPGEIGVDRRPVQRMGKGQLQRRGVFDQQPGCDRRIHLVPRIGQLGNRHDRRDRRVLAQHRSRRQQGLSRCRERGHAGQDHRGQLPRRRQPASLRRAQPGDADLLEQRRQYSALPSAWAANRDAPRCDSTPSPSALASSVRSPGLNPPRRIRVTRESPPTNRAQPGSASPPVRVDTTASTLSARSRRRANSTARPDGRSAQCRSSTASTTT